MAVTQNNANQPKRVRVRTLRPWLNVTRDTDTGEPIRREIEVGEVVEVDRNLAGDLISCLKAEAVDPSTPTGKAGKAKKPADSQPAG